MKHVLHTRSYRGADTEIKYRRPFRIEENKKEELDIQWKGEGRKV